MNVSDFLVVWEVDSQGGQREKDYKHKRHDNSMGDSRGLIRIADTVAGAGPGCGWV